VSGGGRSWFALPLTNVLSTAKPALDPLSNGLKHDVQYRDQKHANRACHDHSGEYRDADRRCLQDRQPSFPLLLGELDDQDPLVAASATCFGNAQKLSLRLVARKPRRWPWPPTGLGFPAYVVAAFPPYPKQYLASCALRMSEVSGIRHHQAVPSLNLSLKTWPTTSGRLARELVGV
jgi:hypothetical protein